MASKKLPRQPQGEVADIALLLEGTYPYVRGGVSSWVHQIISGMPERTFSIAFGRRSRTLWRDPLRTAAERDPR